MPEEVIIAHALSNHYTWYIYRTGGEEVKLWLDQGDIFSNLTLTKEERKYILNNILRPSKINNDENL